MQLKDILDICRANEVEHFEYTVVNGDINTTVTGIASDSRKCNRRRYLCLHSWFGKRWT